MSSARARGSEVQWLCDVRDLQLRLLLADQRVLSGMQSEFLLFCAGAVGHIAPGAMRIRSRSLALGAIPDGSEVGAAGPGGEALPDVENVLGGGLERCSVDPLTGWFRDGYCRTDESDRGRHLVCVQTTEDFLRHQRSIGNDLSTPAPMYGFPGLKPGDSWCVCASRWAEAVIAGVAAPIRARATHVKARAFAPEETLLRLAIDGL
eukprot:CAMPEP_0179113170 /NCGR_PEP_ID=MMETSP0796-20121207/52936_1 /TAXON_ID=73915 /ORGANISM="Pyrodinium bahamense, Strain pbaha01" /LENGTH=205 /DNA_ID=CAMNT_0020811361 /DNA_START=1 /DNA_END=619 /DNA_ORIENTATION=-